MDKASLQAAIDACHARGQKVAVCFCAHVPAEILEAAGFCVLRLFHLDDVEDISSRALPRNLCPIVKECYSLLEDPVLQQADLIITESSCDGKKKMYELISCRDKTYYYQVPQGAERDYVRPLMRSEANYLIKTLHSRFGAEVTDEGLRRAGAAMNAERAAMMDLMALQKSTPPAASGLEIYEVFRAAQVIADRAERAAFLRKETDRLARQGAGPSGDARRILLTGCPIGGIYQKLIHAVEDNGGVVVCMENCEFVKSNHRRLDLEKDDMIEALVDCYQDTPCAIMESNERRFRLIAELAEEYKADGVIDAALQTCHPYTVEREKLHRFCAAHDLPYLYIESDHSDTDAGQMNTRIAAFIELL